MEKKSDFTEQAEPLFRFHITREESESMVVDAHDKLAEENRAFSLEQKIMRFLAQVGFATRRQIVRLLEREEHDSATVEKEFKRLANLKLIEKFSIAPPAYLEIDLPRFTIFYASEKARDRMPMTSLENLRGIYLKNEGRFGLPEKEANPSKMTRELLMTESYLWFAAQGYQIIEILSRNHWKKQLGRKRWDKLEREQRLEDKVLHESKRKWDYKISVIKPGLMHIHSFQCNIALKTPLGEIERIWKNTKWFCLTKLQAATIWTATDEKGIILEDFIEDERNHMPKGVLAEFDKAKGKKQKITIEEREKQIVKILERMGGGCTSEILMLCLKVSRSLINGLRFSITSLGRVKNDKSSAKLGTTRGTTSLLWCLSGNELNVREIKEIFYRSMALSVFLEGKRKWKLDYFDAKTQSIVIKRDNLICAVKVDKFEETSAFSIGADADTMNRLIANYRKQGISFKYFCFIKKRYEVLLHSMPKENLVDWSDDIKLKSYYRKSDLRLGVYDPDDL